MDSRAFIHSRRDNLDSYIASGTEMKKRTWTRGEDLAVMALRLFSDMSLREIGAVIGRSPESVNTHMNNTGMRTHGWRLRFNILLGASR